MTTTHKIANSRVRRPLWVGVYAILALTLTTSTVAAQERLCDNSFEDCRSSIINMIRAEMVGLDVSFWFMTDTRYSTEIIRKWQAGVPVRILLDLRSDTNYPAGATVRQSLINAGIPIRHKTTTGINHWKMILYAGQRKVHFSAANFAHGSYSPVTPYEDYVDEAIYFTDDSAIVDSFMRKYDDLWIDTTHYANLANVNGALTRNYGLFPIDPSLNFPPDQDYQDRLIAQMRQETEQIDVVMFRITSGKVPDEMIRRVQAGVPIRLITDKLQYRNPTYFWHSYNIDRMYMAGIPIKWKRSDAVTDQDMHQKSVILYGRNMVAFGSSNWTASSSDTQREHNYFTPKQWFVDWFISQFGRKWNNKQSNGTTDLSTPIYLNYEPGYPEPPVNSAPANQALGVGTTVTLRWEGGWWAHKYDIYFGTTNPPPLIASNYMPGSATAGVVSTKESFNPCTPPTGFVSACPSGLAPATTYYWKIRGKTMVGDGGGPLGAPARAITGPIWSFTTAGGVPPPPAPVNLRVNGDPSATSVGLAWDDVAGEEGYKVERKLASASSTAWAQIATTPANITTYTNNGLTPNTAYNYRVRAYTTGGNSGYSNTLTATTDATSPDTGRILADTYVRAGQYANTNYGTGSELIVKFSGDAQYHRQAFIKLNITDVTQTSTVTLRLAGRLSDTRAASVPVQIFRADNTTWSETSANWTNTRTIPLGSAPVATLSVSGTTAQWYSVDLTAFLRAERAAGRTTVSIALTSPADTLPYATFGSRETASSPQLVITP